MEQICEFLDSIEYRHLEYKDTKTFTSLETDIQVNGDISDEHFQQLGRADRAITALWARNGLVTPVRVETLKTLARGNYTGEYAKIGEHDDTLPIPITNSEDVNRYIAFIPLEKYCQRIQERYLYGTYPRYPRHRW